MSADQGAVRAAHQAAIRALEAETTRRIDVDEPSLGMVAVEALATHAAQTALAELDSDRLSSGRRRLDAAGEAAVLDRVLALVVGHGPVDVLLADPTVEEIVATRFDVVFVYRSGKTPERLTERLWDSESELASWLAHEARTAGRTERQFNGQEPLLVMRLGDRLRLAAQRDVSKSVGFTLRRNTMGNVTIDDLVARDMFDPVVADLFRAVMASTEMRVVFAGPTGSGKTTCARACLDELAPHLRMVIIEDTAELDMFDEVRHPNVEEWEQRNPNAEGQGEISQGLLVKHALRARPDWLVAGEVRDSDAAVPMIKAMTHGQSSMTTVHAPSAVGALDKLAVYLGTGEDRLPAQVSHHQLSMAIDFVVHVDRDAAGHRYVTEVVEVSGFDGDRCTTNSLYRHRGNGGARSGSSMMTQARIEKLADVGFDARTLDRVGATL